MKASPAARPMARAGVLVPSLLVLLAGVLLPASSATAATPIGPGVQMETAGAQCTANFVFTDRTGARYVGYAAHCAGTGSSSDTNGCTTASLPYGTRVRFAVGINQLSAGTTVGYGRLVYSSWREMQRAGIRSGAICYGNDLALVRVDSAYVTRVNPTVPSWGGPTALAAPPAVGATVFTYGASSLRGPAPKKGTMRQRGTWLSTVFTSNVGIPGDSGSGFMDARGRAFGVLSTLNLLPDPGTNGVGSLANQVAFARTHGKPYLALMKGRVAFTGR